MREATRRWLSRLAMAVVLVAGTLWLGLQLGRPLHYTDGLVMQDAGQLAHAGMLQWQAPEPVTELPGPVVGRVAVLPDGALVYGRTNAAGDADLVRFDPARPQVPPEPLAGLNTDSHELAPAVGADGRLYFASDRPGGAGGYDLYVAARRPFGYGPPEPLAQCNTALDETDPAPPPGAQEFVFVRIDRAVAGGDDGVLWRCRLGGDGDPVPLFGPSSRRGRAVDRDPAYARDGSALWFVRRSPGGPLQVCRASCQLGEFAAPAPLGSAFGGGEYRAPLPLAEPWRLGLWQPRRGESGADLWYEARGRELPPWWPGQRWIELLLLGLLATALLLVVLLHFGRRFHGLDLLAQCLLLSLLVHVLLFLWLWGVEIVTEGVAGEPDGEEFAVTIVTGSAAAAAGGAALEEAVAAAVRFQPSERSLAAVAPTSAPVREAVVPAAPSAAPLAAAAPAATDVAAPSLQDAAAAAPGRAGGDEVAAATALPLAPVAAAALPVAADRAVSPASSAVLAVAAPGAELSKAAAGTALPAAPAPDGAATPVARSLPPPATALADAPAAVAPRASAGEAAAVATPSMAVDASPTGPAPVAVAPARVPASTAAPGSLAAAAPPAAGLPSAASPPAAAAAGPLATAVPVPRANARPETPALQDHAVAAAAPAAAPAAAAAAARPEPLAAAAAAVAGPAAAPAPRVVRDGTARPAAPAAVAPAAALVRPAAPAAADSASVPPPAAAAPAPRRRPPAPALRDDAGAPAVARAQPQPRAAWAAPALPLALAMPDGPAPALLAPRRAASAAPVGRAVRSPLAPPGSLLARAAAPLAATAAPLPVAGASAYSNRFGPQKQRALEQYGGSAATERAVANGLRYLARIQNADGSWGDRERFDDKYGFVHVGKTALCALAFLGAGHTPAAATEHRDVVARAFAYLVAIQDPDTGAFGPSSCYGHGIATYALAECYGLTKDPALQKPLEAALAWILANQGPRQDRRNRGGWGYFSPGLQAEDTYARVSVTAWMVMALESARLSGIDLPADALPKVREYLELAYDAPNGWFRYNHKPSRINSAWPTLPASTPAAGFCLQLLGAPADEAKVQAAVAYTVERRPEQYRRYQDDDFVQRGQGNVYFWYYGSLCCFLAGGEAWEQWNERLRTVLPAAQAEDGSFPPIDTYATLAGDSRRDRSYTTAMCVLCLEVYYRYFTPLLVGR